MPSPWTSKHRSPQRGVCRDSLTSQIQAPGVERGASKRVGLGAVMVFLYTSGSQLMSVAIETQGEG